MSYLAMQQIKSGFIEAMYFADGADPDLKDDEGFYLDGQFNNCFDLSENAQKNINDLLETIAPKLPTEIFDVLTLDRIGMCIYYEVQGHGTGFQDEDLAEETIEQLYQLFFNSVFLEIWDNEDTQEIELSYTSNWGCEL